MDKIEGVSNELKTWVERKVCRDCRFRLHYGGMRDDECVNPDSPKFDIGISGFDSCPFWEKKVND